MTKQLSVTTLAKVAPEVAIENPETTDTTVDAKFSVTDKDGICTITSVKIFNGETEVAESAEKQIAFENLSYYTEYQVVVAFCYDLNDGEGIHNETATIQCKTSPHLAFNSCKVINTSAVSEGETIYMQATLDNPSCAMPISAVVNGKTYSLASSTSANKVYLEIVYNDQFDGGNTILNIEKINMALDGKTYTVKTEQNNSGNVFINGKLEVESLQLVNSEGKAVNWCSPDDNPYYLLTLKNKTGYTLDSVELYQNIYYTTTSTILTKIDDEHYKLDYNAFQNGWNYATVASVTYHNDYLNKTLGVNQESNRVFLTNDSVEIATREKLLSTDFSKDYKYYKLTADIDLSGIEWTNLGTLNGVFDGNGHKISGMSNVSTVTDKDIVIGLFAEASGVITSVDLTDVTVMMTLKTTNEKVHNICFGGLTASIDNTLVITSCSVQADVSFKNTTTAYIDTSGQSSPDADIGGFIGAHSATVLIKGSKSNVSLNCTDDAGNYIGSNGGFIGYGFWTENISIENCESVCTIQGENVGGLIGYNYSSTGSNVQVSNTTVEMHVSNAKNAGGLISSSGNGNVQVSHVTANVEVDAAEFVGGLIGITSSGVAAEISDCNVTAILDNIVYCGGGLVGRMETAATIDNCDVSVTFRDTLESTDSIQYAGGLVGRVSYLKVTNTTVTVDAQNTYEVGGLACYFNDEIDVINTTVSIKAQKSHNVGGIVSSTGANTVHVSDSTITLEATDIDGYAGGISGICSSTVTIDNCVITSILSMTTQRNGPSTYAGGLFGHFAEDLTVTDSTVDVQIQKADYAGGLVGEFSVGDKIEIDSCDISGKLDASGIHAFGNNIGTTNSEIKDTTYDLLINGVQQTNKPAQETEQEQ